MIAGKEAAAGGAVKASIKYIQNVNDKGLWPSATTYARFVAKTSWATIS